VGMESPLAAQDAERVARGLEWMEDITTQGQGAHEDAQALVYRPPRMGVSSVLCKLHFEEITFVPVASTRMSYLCEAVKVRFPALTADVRLHHPGRTWHATHRGHAT